MFCEDSMCGCSVGEAACARLLCSSAVWTYAPRSFLRGLEPHVASGASSQNAVD